MSIFKKLSERIVKATESGEMKRVRLEAEKRHAAKSSGQMAKVRVNSDPIERQISKLSGRIDDAEDKMKKT